MSPHELKSLFTFVIKSLNYAEANPTLCPGYANVPEQREDRN